MNSRPDAAPPSSRDASVDDREYLDTLAAHGESGEAGLGIHLLELDGRFIYAGTVPIQLAHAQPDGSPLTPEQIESVQLFGLPTSTQSTWFQQLFNKSTN